MKGLKKLGDWLAGMFDIDMAALGRSVLGDTLYGFLFGDTAEAQIMAKKKEIEMHKKELKEGDTRTAMGFSSEGEIEDLEKAIAKLEKEKEVAKPTTGKPAIDIAKTAETVAAPVEAIKETVTPKRKGRRSLKEKFAENKIKRQEKAEEKSAYQTIMRVLGMEESTKFDVQKALGALKAESGIEAVSKLFSMETLTAANIKLEHLKQGGLIKTSGLAEVHKHELMLDNQAASVFMKAAQLLTNSQVLEQSRAGGGPPVVINQVDNSQANPVISNQATQIKASESPHARESTKILLDQAYAMG